MQLASPHCPHLETPFLEIPVEATVLKTSVDHIILYLQTGGLIIELDERLCAV